MNEVDRARRDSMITMAVTAGRLEERYRAVYERCWETDPVATESVLAGESFPAGLAAGGELSAAASVLSPAERQQLADRNGFAATATGRREDELPSNVSLLTPAERVRVAAMREAA